MKKIILNCYWFTGDYNFVCEFDENSAHYDVKSYRTYGRKDNEGNLTGEKLKEFLEKVNNIDFSVINHEDAFPSDGAIMDYFTIEFLYEDNNRFYTCRWKIGCETETMEQMEDLIGTCDINFYDFFPMFED